MSKNKGGREVRKPKQAKVAKVTSEVSAVIKSVTPKKTK